MSDHLQFTRRECRPGLKRGNTLGPSDPPCRDKGLLFVLLVNLYHRTSASKNVEIERAAACRWTVQSKSAPCNGVDLFYL
jgi:hypothetical protein